MTGHSNEIVSKILWADAELETVTIDFEELEIRLTESSGKETTLRCKGYIGYSCVGFWDEAIIEKARVLDTSDLQEECLHNLSQRYGTELPDSGDPARNRQSYKTLEIQFIDGTVLGIVAGQFAIE